MCENEFILIEKEMVSNLKFPLEEILNDEIEISKRNINFELANSLGNLEHHKIKIYFCDNIGKKMINTTIWSLTDTSILLKKNVIIPKNRIIKLEI